MNPGLKTIPVRGGAASRVARGSSIEVINTHGSQVVDTWAFLAGDVREFMSMEHTRASCRRLCPGLGASFVTNKRRPILTLVEDTSPRTHDTLIAACDVHRYEQLGHAGYHENCTENLQRALAGIGLETPEIPCPLNLFMNIAVASDGALEWRTPTGTAGDRVVLRAEMDLVVVFSACPMDIIPINGADCRPTEAHFRVSGDLE